MKGRPDGKRKESFRKKGDSHGRRIKSREMVNLNPSEVTPGQNALEYRIVDHSAVVSWPTGV